MNIVEHSTEKQSAAPATFQSPDYQNAPVIETSLAVRFAVPSKWNVHVFGLLQERLADAFPIFETAPPIIMSESGRPQVTVSTGTPRIRALYWSASRDRLVQLQDNLFCMNWRKAESSIEYPRYTALREAFIKQWSDFLSLLDCKQLGKPNLEGCSVTYINRIDPLQMDNSDVCTYLTTSPEAMRARGLTLASETLSLTFTRRHQQITYLLQPAIELPTNAKVTQLTLVSDNKFSKVTEDPMVGLDEAHELLIETFEGLSSTRAKATWGKQ